MRRSWTSLNGPLPALLAFAALALLFLGPLTLHPNWAAYPPKSSYTDLLVSHQPNALYLRWALLTHGQLPLWNTLLFAGQPFAADPLAGLWYPPNLLLLVLPLPFGFNFLLALHLAWAGYGLYRFLRVQGLAAGPAFLGGLALAGTPKLIAHLGAGHVSLVFAIAWTPWLLLAVQPAVQRGGAWSGAQVGAVLALTFLADVRWAFYAGCLAAAYGVFAFLADKRRRSVNASGRAAWPGSLTALLAALLVFALLSAALALPLAEFVEHSRRAALSLEEAGTYSLPPRYLLGLLIPDLYGFHEWMTYLGVIPLLLVPLGVRRQTLFWLAVVAVAGLFSLGNNFSLYPALFRLLPGLSLLRVPPRAWFLVALGAGVLAAHGAHRLQCEVLPRLGQRYAQRGRRWPAPAHVMSALLVLAALDLVRVDATLLDPRPVAGPVPAAAWLLRRPGRFRVYSPSYSLPPGYGLEHLDGVDPMQLDAPVGFIERAVGRRAEGYSVTVPAYPETEAEMVALGRVMDAQLLGLLNVRYVAAEFPVQAPGFIWRGLFGSTYLYENAAYRERAWLEGGTATPVESVAWSPNRIELVATGPGRLVLSEVMYPGWHVFVDGRPAALEAAHGLFRAVTLPDGQHRVVFEFRPLSVYAGGLLSLAGVTLVAVLWARARRRPA